MSDVIVSEKAEEMIRQFLNNQDGSHTVRILQPDARSPGLNMTLDKPDVDDVTITAGDIAFAINGGLLKMARPIRIDFIESGGQSGFQITSRLPKGGCGL